MHVEGEGQSRQREGISRDAWAENTECTGEHHQVYFGWSKGISREEVLDKFGLEVWGQIVHVLK